MRKNCLLAAALLISAAIGAPQIAKAMESPSPSPPSNPPSGSTTTSKQKTKIAKAEAAEQQFAG